MNVYLIVDKSTNNVLSKLTLNGDYFINTHDRFSILLASDVEMDFGSYVYTLDVNTGILSKVPLNIPTPSSLITPLEVTLED